jgi:hypothetical protein
MRRKVAELMAGRVRGASSRGNAHTEKPGRHHRGEFGKRAKCGKYGGKRVDVGPNWKEKTRMPHNGYALRSETAPLVVDAAACLSQSGALSLSQQTPAALSLGH